jgi:CBS domain-containing protein
MENLDTFLGRHPPFDRLDPALVSELAARAGRHEQAAAGVVVLTEDGPPASGLWVILSGSMELVHQGEVISTLGPGECFGHPSLLTGMAPAFTVRAREPSCCALLAADDARRVLATEPGVAYVAQTLRLRLTRAGQTVHGLHEVGTTPVSAIMRPATFVPAEMPLREALRELDRAEVTALLVGGGESDVADLAIVGDAEVRAALGDERITLDTPLRAVARFPVPAVPVGQLAIEATVDMLAAGAEHLAVIKAGRVCGLVSARDLLGLDARSPIGLRHTILGAADQTVLERAVSHLPALFLALSRAGVPPRDLGRVLSLQHDAVVARLVDFSISRRGPAPLAWAWLDLGSAARREFTLASDQDNALAYADPPADDGDEVDAYFAHLGADVNAGLASCGIGVDHNGVLARERRWRMSRHDWLRTFDEVLTEPDESHLVRASVAFDFRPAAGGLAMGPELTARMRAARKHPQFMRLLARAAAGAPVALGFRSQLSTDREGRLDLKAGAIIPLVNLVRYHALANGVTISPTLDRIEAAAAAEGLPRADADALAEAFTIVTRVRMDHHAQRLEAGEPADNMIDPGALAPIARGELREALQAVRRAQKRLPV